MRNNEIYDLIEYEDLPNHFRIVADVCGMDIARILIRELGGIQISIPMVVSMKKLIERYIEIHKHTKNVKQLARDLGMNERAIANILKRLN